MQFEKNRDVYSRDYFRTHHSANPLLREKPMTSFLSFARGDNPSHRATNSPQPSTDSEQDRGLEYEVVSFKFKKEAGKTRILVRYDDGAYSIIRDPCEAKFCKILLENAGNALERAQAKRSLKKFSRFLLDNRVEVSGGLDCWNSFCSGRACGIYASRGMLFIPPEDFQTHGDIASTPAEQGYYKVHITTPISRSGRITNKIKLTKGRIYLVGCQMNVTIPRRPASFHPRYTCECEQCVEDGVSRDLEEVIINPLEVLSHRYQSTQVAAQGMWPSSNKALVRKDGDGTHRIRGYLTSDIYSDYVCDQCKSMGKVTRCPNDCLEKIGRKDGADVDIVEPGSAAVVGEVLEFCRPRYRKLRKALKRVIERLNVLGLRQGGAVLSDIARLVRASRMEVVFVLNNDTSLVQPVISGANCFLRRDSRGRWNSGETLTGKELNKQIFFVDSTGVWIMIGIGDKYGVSLSDSGIYHLVLGGGDSMVYGAHLDTQHFGGMEE